MKSVLATMRIPFLVLTPACVLLGLASARWTAGEVSWLDFALAMFGAVAAHISVNAFNEYFDFKSGLDALTERTPFSGGSGTLPSEPSVAKSTLAMAIATLVICAAVGVYFTFKWGPMLLPLGAVGLLIVFAYTKWITKSPILCLIAPGIGFGPLMVIGTHFALTGSFSVTAAVASLIPFFLVNDLLLLNQFPDVEADRQVGRRHLPILIGRTRSSRVYISFLLLPFAAIGAAVALHLLPIWSLIGLAPLVIAIPLAIGVHRNAEQPKQLLPYMGRNVLVNLLTPTLVAIGTLVG